MRGLAVTLNSGGSNTVVAKYKSNGLGAAFFANRWLFALRYANVR